MQSTSSVQFGMTLVARPIIGEETLDLERAVVFCIGSGVMGSNRQQRGNNGAAFDRADHLQLSALLERAKRAFPEDGRGQTAAPSERNSSNCAD